MKNHRIILIRNLLSVFVLVTATASDQELSDEEKAAALEARKPEIRQRLEEHYEKTPLETKRLIREVSDYNFGRSDSIPLVKEILQPDGDPLDQLFPIRKIRFDDHTLPMMVHLLEVSPEDSIKSKIVWRLRDEILTGKLELNPEIEALLKNYAKGEYVDSDLRRASNLTLRQANELNEKVAAEASAEVVEQNIAEPPLSSSAPDVEEVAQESTAPEPATEKPAEVKTPDTSKEPAEQSSNWWLWLIGAVVVVGGIALVVRRKG